MKQIVIYGSGKLAEILTKVFDYEKNFAIAAYTVDAEYMNTSEFLGKPLVALDECARLYPPEKYDMFVAIGYKNMRNRSVMFDTAKQLGYYLPNYIGKKVISYEDMLIGENNLIFNGCYIGPFGRMGDNNIIRPNCYIGHNFNIGSHNHISPGCNIGGNSRIKDLCFIGIGATLIDGLTIVDETLIGAGSVLLQDTEKYSFFAGNPARKIKEHAETGIIINR